MKRKKINTEELMLCLKKIKKIIVKDKTNSYMQCVLIKNKEIVATNGKVLYSLYIDSVSNLNGVFNYEELLNFLKNNINKDIYAEKINFCTDNEKIFKTNVLFPTYNWLFDNDGRIGTKFKIKDKNDFLKEINKIKGSNKYFNVKIGVKNDEFIISNEKNKIKYKVNVEYNNLDCEIYTNIGYFYNIIDCCDKYNDITIVLEENKLYVYSNKDRFILFCSRRQI